MRVLVSSMALGLLYRTKFRVFSGEASRNEHYNSQFFTGYIIHPDI
jgi:hypothetical protein